MTTNPQRPPAGEPSADLLTQRLMKLLRLLDGQVNELLAEHGGLRILQWRVLAQLTGAPEHTVRSLAENLSISRSEASRAATALVELGHALRRDDPADARSALFVVTDAGRALYERIYPRRVEAMRRLMATVSAEDAAVFDRTLEALTTQLESESASPGRLRTRTGRRRRAG
ncbi:MarR family transcriptional regulator [Streptomyces sp. NPDC004542]|uniref:MarR family winged helix-turn-helix transcriptional regulator n=1 Tax=Streptomyces sp. NPDC004542 TaxID=3154281 RepID=UPI0033AFAA2D